SACASTRFWYLRSASSAFCRLMRPASQVASVASLVQMSSISSCGSSICVKPLIRSVYASMFSVLHTGGPPNEGVHFVPIGWDVFSLYVVHWPTALDISANLFLPFPGGNSPRDIQFFRQPPIG